MPDNEYKEVDTDSFLAQSKDIVLPLNYNVLKMENELIGTYSKLMAEKHELLQQVYKLEQDMAYYQQKIDECQRIRIKAANAGAKPQSKLIKDLQNETGYSLAEINRALKLMYKTKDSNGKEKTSNR